MLKRGLACLTVAAAMFGIAYVLRMLGNSLLPSIAELLAFVCGVSGLFTLTTWATQGEGEQQVKKAKN